MYISPQVLVLASRYDFSCDYVIAQLQKRDISYFRLNSEDFEEFSVVGDPVESSVSLFSKDFEVHLNQETLKSIYFRRAVYPREPRKDRDLPHEQLSRIHISALMRNFMMFDGCVWINHPVATYKAEHKGVQLQTAHRVGFDIPRTVVTNHARGIRQVAQKDKRVAIKGLETVLVWQDSLETFGYTSLVNSSLAEQAHLASAPLIAQQALEEKLDLRVTVVGDQIFCASITANGRPVDGDWRLKKSDAEFRPFDLPHDISAKCLNYTETLNLSFGAIDLALHNGKFYFLEINPTGEWGWLVDDAQLAIDVALADALLNYR